MQKTPRGWIQIGESRTRGVARIPLGLKPSRDSRATSQRDSPIWIQPLGVFRYITSWWYNLNKKNQSTVKPCANFVSFTVFYAFSWHAIGYLWVGHSLYVSRWVRGPAIWLPVQLCPWGGVDSFRIRTDWPGQLHQRVLHELPILYASILLQHR